MHSSFARALAAVRDASQPPGRRAFLAAALAAGDLERRGAAGDNPSLRMFGFDVVHADASPWDGRSTRSGTITYIDDERVEHYIGQQRWIAYRTADLGDFHAEVGDQVRITRRGAGVAVEPIGPNRLAGDASAARQASSGMVVVRSAAFAADELASLAEAVGERYAAALRPSDGAIALEFGAGAARLTIESLDPAALAELGSSVLLGAPVGGALRLAVAVRSDKSEAAADAERGLMLFAAMATSDAEGLALCDGGAILSSEALYGLGTHNEMRADAFAFAAALAQRAFPAQRAWPAAAASTSDRPAVCDELTVFSSRPWRADFAARFLDRQLRGIADAANANDDAVVPKGGRFIPPEERAAPGGLERLATLSYETVAVDIAFIDLTTRNGELGEGFEARKDVAALLGGSIVSAVVLSISPSEDAADSKLAVLDLRRAQTFVTALAAIFARRGDSIAADLDGAIYSVDDLLTLALRRGSTAASWNARVAAFGAAQRAAAAA